MIYWLTKYVLLGPLLRAVWRPWTEGLENVPDEGPAILASNHLAFCDSFFMPLLVAPQGDLPGEGGVLHHPRPQGLVLPDVLLRRRPGADRPRRPGRVAGGADAPACGCSPSGKLLGIYPEGTRSPDGRLYRGKTGVARHGAGVRRRRHPVRHDQHRRPSSRPGRVLPRLRPRPGVRFGKPLDFSRYEGMAGDRLVERSMTDEIMYELMQLSGQEYVDLYAARREEGAGAQHRLRRTASAGAGATALPDTRAS